MAKPNRKDGRPKSQQSVEVQVESLEEFIALSEADSKTPTVEWLYNTFKTKSAIIRYLHLEIGMDVKQIAGYMNFEYRHVYSVVGKSKNQLPAHVCPVCKNRKG